MMEVDIAITILENNSIESTKTKHLSQQFVMHTHTYTHMHMHTPTADFFDMYSSKKCTEAFTAALFILALNTTQSKCPVIAGG